MRRGLVLGAYVPASTPLHRADARAKAVLLGALTVAAFASGPAGLAVVAAALAGALALSRTSPAAVLRALRPAALLLCFSLAANALVLGPQDPASGTWGLGPVGVSPEGAARALLAVGRIAVVVGLSLVFSATTMPPAIADALASLLSPLARLGVRVGDVAMTVSVALRFIPIATEEIDRIRCAQRARGARLDEGGAVARLRGWQRTLVPLLVSLFRRADDLAAAMGDRCYSGEGQTAMTGPLAPGDWALLACGLALSLAACLA